MSGHKANIGQRAAFQIEAKAQPLTELLVRVRKGDDLLTEQFVVLQADEWVQISVGDLVISLQKPDG